ncbi:AraC family transcriptional regulator [Kaistella haifensis]|nr:AraC family transcriptional regulator [Kaistella haifensis]
MKEKLAKAIDEKKLYLNPKLSITDLAKECQTNTIYIFDYLNNELKINFFYYINRERIEKMSITLLLNKNNRMEIEEIPYSSGFGSVFTFRRAFEKLKVTSPLNFKKNRIKNSPKIFEES